MSKRVYKFLSAEYGLSNLERKRLKLSKIEELNDPFDTCAINTTNPVFSHAVDLAMAEFRKSTTILCFSRNWDNILLWSHYGASHTGICLGFDVPDGNDHSFDVRYQPSLLQFDRPEDINFDLAKRLLTTKHESWSYEQEVRFFVSLNDPPDEKGLNWVNFGPKLILKEVIMGAQCHPSLGERIKDQASTHGDAVKCWWAGMRSDAFLLVKLKMPPDWHTQVR